MEVMVMMDLSEKKVVIADGGGKWEYACGLKDATVYYFGIAGADWKVKIMHIS